MAPLLRTRPAFAHAHKTVKRGVTRVAHSLTKSWIRPWCLYTFFTGDGIHILNTHTQAHTSYFIISSVCVCAAGLGNTVSEIDVSSAQVFSKTLFSMAIPEVMEALSTEPNRNAVVLFGIETQVCVYVGDSVLDLPLLYVAPTLCFFYTK